MYYGSRTFTNILSWYLTIKFFEWKNDNWRKCKKLYKKFARKEKIEQMSLEYRKDKAKANQLGLSYSKYMRAVRKNKRIKENIMFNFTNIIDLAKKNIDIHTIPLNNKKPLWFSLYYENDTVYVDSAKNNSPKSAIKSPMPLNKNEFDAMLDIYNRRLKGEKVSKEATKTTRMQVYWYGIFEELKKGFC